MVGYYLPITTLFTLIIQKGREPDCSIKLSIELMKKHRLHVTSLNVTRHENYRILRMLVILFLQKEYSGNYLFLSVAHVSLT